VRQGGKQAGPAFSNPAWRPKWRRRFLKDRCNDLFDEIRPGRPRTIDDDQVAAVIERTLRATST
jgi:transposase